MTTTASDIRPGRRLIAVILVGAAALDLARCCLVLMTVRHPALTAALVAAGLAAAAVSLRTARGCRTGRRWSGLTALLIGALSAPQAAASGFHAPYAIPDMATAALGVLLAVTVLATASPARQPGHDTGNSCVIDQEPPVDDQEPPVDEQSHARMSLRSAGRHPPQPDLRRVAQRAEHTATRPPPRPQ
jgi:hypothetical protein